MTSKAAAEFLESEVDKCRFSATHAEAINAIINGLDEANAAVNECLRDQSELTKERCAASDRALAAEKDLNDLKIRFGNLEEIRRDELDELAKLRNEVALRRQQLGAIQLVLRAQ